VVLAEIHGFKLVIGLIPTCVCWPE